MGTLDLTNRDNQKYASYQDSRTQSIERQVAAKCVAQVYTGAGPTEKDYIVASFNLFLQLIRGE